MEAQGFDVDLVREAMEWVNEISAGRVEDEISSTAIRVLRLFVQQARALGRIPMIVEVAKAGKMNYNTCRSSFNSLVSDGYIARLSKGKYGVTKAGLELIGAG